MRPFIVREPGNSGQSVRVILVDNVVAKMYERLQAAKTAQTQNDYELGPSHLAKKGGQYARLLLCWYVEKCIALLAFSQSFEIGDDMIVKKTETRFQLGDQETAQSVCNLRQGVNFEALASFPLESDEALLVALLKGNKLIVNCSGQIIIEE